MKTSTKALTTGTILLVVLGVTSIVFYRRAQTKQQPKTPLILTAAVIGRPLPKSNLINISGQPLDDAKLRQGKMVLVFVMPDCKPCDQENEFLKTVVALRQDVTFRFVIPFGNRNGTLKLAEGRYASEAFFDAGSPMSKELQLYQVPIKLFVEDGIIKQTWLDATTDSKAQEEFKNWLLTA